MWESMLYYYKHLISRKPRDPDIYSWGVENPMMLKLNVRTCNKCLKRWFKINGVERCPFCVRE